MCVHSQRLFVCVHTHSAYINTVAYKYSLIRACWGGRKVEMGGGNGGRGGARGTLERPRNTKPLGKRWMPPPGSRLFVATQRVSDGAWCHTTMVM